MRDGTLSNKHLSLCTTIHQFLVDIFYKLELNTFQHSIVTITEVELTPDKRECRVYVSIMDMNISSLLMENIESKKTEIKTLLANKLRFRLRYIPKELNFYIDATNQKADRVLQLLEEIKLSNHHTDGSASQQHKS